MIATIMTVTPAASQTNHEARVDEIDAKDLRESGQDTRARVLQAALDIFCEKGYGASVDDIARRAGVVKQTLYHHCGSKGNLFRDAFGEVIRTMTVGLLDTSGPVREGLLRFTVSFEAEMASERGTALHRMMHYEMARFPELAQAIHASWMTGRDAIIRLLRAAMARGELREDDPDFAADVFMSLLVGGKDRSQMLSEAGKAAELETWGVRVVDVFLRAYAVEPAQKTKQKEKAKDAKGMLSGLCRTRPAQKQK
jgi:AcrR family transcriptional regulator